MHVALAAMMKVLSLQRHARTKGVLHCRHDTLAGLHSRYSGCAGAPSLTFHSYIYITPTYIYIYVRTWSMMKSSKQSNTNMMFFPWALIKKQQQPALVLATAGCEPKPPTSVAAEFVAAASACLHGGGGALVGVELPAAHARVHERAVGGGGSRWLHKSMFIAHDVHQRFPS